MIRACRAYTGRTKIIRFEGHFHGYHELIYIGGHPPQDAHPGNRAHPYIESPGIPGEFAGHIIPIPYNDPSALEEVVEKHGGDTAMVILEPVNYNCACIMPQPGYLELLRDITSDHSILLFFDEIQSAFKKSPGGAQEDFGVVPDVCTIGKALGGGLPLSAFCGKAEIMDMYQPVGPVQHSGTFNAHIVPVLSGLAFMKELAKPGFYQHLSALETQFHEGMTDIIEDNGLNMLVPHHGARFNIMLGRKTPALKYEDTFCHDSSLMLNIIRTCWERGVYFHDYGGGPLHHGYSVQHTSEDIDQVLSVLGEVLPAALA
jgi:glutamate-1-semialdehyde 2,1-aminomutase